MTRMMKRALINFGFRLIVFLFIFSVYILHKDVLVEFMTHEFTFGISEYGIRPLHVLWAIFMIMMLQHIIPHKYLSMAYRKGNIKGFEEVEGYSRLELLEFIQQMNVKAWFVMLVWLSFNAVFALLYLFKIITVADMESTWSHWISGSISLPGGNPRSSGLLAGSCVPLSFFLARSPSSSAGE